MLASACSAGKCEVLTSWWYNSFTSTGRGDQIVPGAYDVSNLNNGRDVNQRFGGSISANVKTGANILRYLFTEHHGNWGLMAEWYTGNDPRLSPAENEQRRRIYREDVLSGLTKFQEFFKCMMGG